MKNFFLLALSLWISANSLSQNEPNSPLSYWYGQLELLGTQHELLFLISPAYNIKNGKVLKRKYIVELLNSTDSTTLPYLVSDVKISSKIVSFTIPSLNATYKGAPDSKFEQIKGQFEQHGYKAPLDLSKVRQEFLEKGRVQTPLPPFAYKTREVSIKHITEEFTLTGTLTLPQDTTKDFPIVVFATGSGPQNRDEEILGHRMFLVIADHLAKNGIGSLRFDDRGVGKSGGEYSQASLVGFSEDLESAFEYLRTQPQFKNMRIGFLGHSEGAMHAWMVTKRRKDIDFLISLAGPAQYGREIIEKQQYDIVFHSTKNDKQASWNATLFRGIIDILSKSDDIELTNQYIREFIVSMHANAPKYIRDDNPLEPLLLVLPPFLNNAWGRQFVVWNPEEYIPFYEKPVLFLIGEQDLQVHPKNNLEGYLRMQNVHSKPLSEAVMLPGLNHLFQLCNTCGIEEYGLLEETIAPIVLEEIKDFLKALPSRP